MMRRTNRTRLVDRRATAAPHTHKTPPRETQHTHPHTDTPHSSPRRLHTQIARASEGREGSPSPERVVLPTPARARPLPHSDREREHAALGARAPAPARAPRARGRRAAGVIRCLVVGAVVGGGGGDSDAAAGSVRRRGIRSPSARRPTHPPLTPQNPPPPPPPPPPNHSTATSAATRSLSTGAALPLTQRGPTSWEPLGTTFAWSTRGPFLRTFWRWAGNRCTTACLGAPCRRSPTVRRVQP